jgi:flavin-dependent dehydrogenase
MAVIPPADFQVIGASFAGSLLAIHLARHGRVVLIDRHLPGSRLKCGGGMPLSVLEGLEVDVPFVPINRAIFSLGGRQHEFPQCYATVDRTLVDQALFRKAVAAGAEFIQGEYPVHDLPAGRSTILATGTPPRPPFGVALAEIVDQESPYPNALFMEIPDELAVGYAWIFPLPGGRLNVGVGTFAERKLSPGMLSACKDRLGIVGRVLKTGGGLLPLRPASRVMDGHAILFGDAAGMAYPLNGEGLAYIANLAPVWADAIHAGQDLNRIWRHSAAYRKLRFGAVALDGLVFAQKTLHLPAYRWATRLSAWARAGSKSSPETSDRQRIV